MRTAALVPIALLAACPETSGGAFLEGQIATCRGSACAAGLQPDRDLSVVLRAEPGFFTRGATSARLEATAFVLLEEGAKDAVVLAFLDGAKPSGPDGETALRTSGCLEAMLSVSIDDVFAGCPSGEPCERTVPVRFHTRGDGRVVGRWSISVFETGSSGTRVTASLAERP